MIILKLAHILQQELSTQNNGGYNGKGGYVFFFNDTLTIEQAKEEYLKLDPNTMYDDKFLSLTAEILLYNSNYQTGIILALEFLRNNADVIHPVISTFMFYESHYNANYHQNSSFYRVFLIFLNSIYLILIIYSTYIFLKQSYLTLVNSCSQRINMFDGHHLFQAIIMLLNYISIVLYFITIVMDIPVVTKNVSEAKFQAYVDAAELIYFFLLV